MCETSSETESGSTVAVGVLLAAGTGSRFPGENKLLADLDGRPLVTHAAEALVAADVDAVCAVLGHEAEQVGEPLSDYDTTVVENPDYDEGQATSVATGAAWASDRDADLAVFHLGDMPAVSTATVDRLLAVASDADVDAVVPTYDGRRGNPVVFRATAFEDLADLEGDAGGRQLFDELTVRRVAVDDPGVRADVDSPEDLDTIGTPGGNDAADAERR